MARFHCFSLQKSTNSAQCLSCFPAAQSPIFSSEKGQLKMHILRSFSITLFSLCISELCSNHPLRFVSAHWKNHTTSYQWNGAEVSSASVKYLNCKAIGKSYPRAHAIKGNVWAISVEKYSQTNSKASVLMRKTASNNVSVGTLSIFFNAYNFIQPCIRLQSSQCQ